MLGSPNNRGAKRRFLILLYLSCFTLSPIVAPPERGFSRGQPEMDQAMDNMSSRGFIVKKAGPTVAQSGAIDYPVLLTSKTAGLLDEAEHVLSNLQDSKEKQWVEAFVQRMRAIAAMLEKTVDMSEQHLPKETNSVMSTPVPEDLPSQPLRPTASAVPGINPFQKSNRVMSKFPVTSPELSHVLPDNEEPNKHQAVTKPAMLSNKQDDAEDDELVRELQSLHQEVAAEFPVQNSKVLDLTPQFTSPAPLVTSDNMIGRMANVEAKKADLKAKFLQEMAEYQRLGGVISNEITDALNKNYESPKGLTYPQETMTEVSKNETKKTGMVDTYQIQSLQDIHNDENTISKPNSESLKLQENVQNQEKQVKRMEINHTFQNTYLNTQANMPAFPKMANHFHYMSPQRNEQPYDKGLENAIQDLRKPNPFNFYGNHQATGSTNLQPGYIPDALKQKMPRPINMVYNNHLAPSGYISYMAKPRYRPYPYMQHWYHKNSTIQLPQGMSPYLPKVSVNRQIDTQLNDEMKRQLRDGKIVVLSDSVVRSNFEGKEEDKTNKPKLDNMDEKKNSTQILN